MNKEYFMCNLVLHDSHFHLAEMSPVPKLKAKTTKKSLEQTI